MRRIIYSVILILIFSILTFADYRKIDPLFFAYIARDTIGERIDFIPFTSSKSIFFSDEKSVSGGFIHYDEVLKKNSFGEIEVIVKGSFSSASLYMTDMVSITDSIFTGFADYLDILQMSEDGAIKFIEMSKPMFQSADSGAYYTRISTMNSYGFTGKNVILGYIDDGFSPDEFCFYKDGESSFSSVWNQHYSRLPSPAGFSYGEELDSEDLKIYHIEDFTGHGTSILSLLSGRSGVEGIVNEATVIGVSCQPTMKGVMDGIKYIEKKGVMLNRPFAVILPMNHFWGTHDGRGLLEEAINFIFKGTAQKRGISVPAGNLGNMHLHAFSEIESFDTLSFPANNPIVISQCVKNYTLDIDVIITGNVYVRFILKDQSGVWKSSWIDIENTRYGYCENSLSYIGFGFNDSLSQLHVALQHENYSLLGIEFSSKEVLSSVECFVSQGGYFLESSVYPSMITGDYEKTIASPALASQAISSSAYVSRRTSGSNLVSPDTLFHILGWSGRAGNGFIKPDLYSPGKFVFAYGKGMWGDVSDDTVSSFQGTSYASAFTGAALIQLLQSDTFLDVSKLYSQLKNGADIVPVELSRENYSPSYGFLNVYNSLKSQTVGTQTNTVSVFSIGDSAVGIRLNDENNFIERIEKNSKSNSIIIKENHFAIDKKPDLGKNIYVLTIKDRFGNTKTSAESFFFESKNSNLPVLCFDITGRITEKKTFKQGVLFEKQGKKVKKIVKF
ncbi:MAG: S8 family serine peptidase [bacterium]|nr:S8 family serine peptidase [bacterium]